MIDHRYITTFKNSVVYYNKYILNANNRFRNMKN